MSNTDTVKLIYESFKRRDIATIFSLIDDDVEWQYGNDSTDVPWQTLRRGKKEVPKYFEALQLVDIPKLDTKQFVEGPGVVLVLIDVHMIVKANGNDIFEEDAIHIWRFNEQGKVVRFRNRCDTHQHMLSLHGT